MIIDTELPYALIHGDWYHVSGELMALAARHGNAVLEAYTGSPNQLWTVRRSGTIRSASGSYLVYDPQGIVRVKTSGTAPENGFHVYPAGTHPFAVVVVPQENDELVLRGSFASRFVDAEDAGVAGGTWLLVNAKAMAMYDGSAERRDA